MLHLQQDFGESGNTRGGFAMADIRFGRSNQTKLGVLGISLKGFAERRNFDGVAQPGTRAMRLDIADMPRVCPGFGQGPTDRDGLRLRVRDRVTVGFAAMIECAASNDPVNVVAVSFCLGESLQYDHSHAFAGNIPVAAFTKALAVAVTGDELSGAEHQVFIRMNADVDPAGNRQAGSPVLQILTGEMNGG